MNFNNYKFNPSTLSKIMTNSKATISETGLKELAAIEKKQIKGKALSEKQEKALPRLIHQRENAENGGITLSVTTENTLKSIYLSERYGKRYKLLSNEPKTGVSQMVRGIKTENQGLILFSEIDGRQYYQYKKVIENDYLSGQLDIIDSQHIETAKKILDIKSSSGIEQFFGKIDSPFTPQNIYQMQGYFALTGISIGEIAHCLVGEPEDVIQEQKQLLFEKYCPDGIENDKFVIAWQKAEQSMRLVDIPKEHRMVSKIVERDDELIGQIYKTIEKCREWLNEYHLIHEEFTTKRYFD